MTLPDSNPDDRLEQSASPTRDAPRPPVPPAPAEADPYDAAEQAAPAGPGEHDAGRDLPLESDDADAAEQAVVVELDEDEHR
ncbi:MAG: hypothetical protein M3P46_07005 [Actinomycetota bacterium]|nr:hypothetical protein [Actinomycetota bacterium]